jgi:hypothetical protein
LRIGHGGHERLEILDRPGVAHEEPAVQGQAGRPAVGRPEAIVTFASQKFDEKTPELEDPTAIDLIKQQLAGCEKPARRVGGKG